MLVWIRDCCIVHWIFLCCHILIIQTWPRFPIFLDLSSFFYHFKIEISINPLMHHSKWISAKSDYWTTRHIYSLSYVGSPTPLHMEVSENSILLRRNGWLTEVCPKHCNGSWVNVLSKAAHQLLSLDSMHSIIIACPKRESLEHRFTSSGRKKGTKFWSPPTRANLTSFRVFENKNLRIALTANADLVAELIVPRRFQNWHASEAWRPTSAISSKYFQSWILTHPSM